MRKPKTRVIHISGRRWFERRNGNTYHTANIYVNGECVGSVPFSYGYGSQFEWNARQWLKENGFLPGIEDHPNGGGDSLWRYCDTHGVKYTQEVVDVSRKRDL